MVDAVEDNLPWLIFFVLFCVIMYVAFLFIHEPDEATPQDTIRVRIVLRKSGKVELKFELLYFFHWFEFDTYKYKTDRQYETKSYGDRIELWGIIKYGNNYICIDKETYRSDNPKDLIEFFLNFHKEQKRIHKERIKGKRIIKERILQ